MIRLFATFATADIVLLTSGLLLTAVETQGPGRLLGPAGALGAILIHALVLAWFERASTRIHSRARALDLPEWVSAQAERFRSKARVAAGLGLVMAFVSGIGDRVESPLAWRLFLGAVGLAVQAGTMLAEASLLGVPRRLARELEAYAVGAPSTGQPVLNR